MEILVFTIPLKEASDEYGPQDSAGGGTAWAGGRRQGRGDGFHFWSSHSAPGTWLTVL